ncbi:MAG: hypothetical protein HY898_16485 [Deltaproteobacteria bacterium]|nr:hypothetical protein [Deltaproteobacteria bacterium]
MNIKAQGLINAARWIEEQHGRPALSAILAECSVGVRDRYIAAVPIEWHPAAELVEFLSVANRLVGNHDGRMWEEVGASGARANLKGVVFLIATYLTKPDALIRRVASVWTQFNDEGELHMTRYEPGLMLLELQGAASPGKPFCGTICGWARELTSAVGFREPVARHIQCTASGASSCVWEVRWKLGSVRPGS